MPPPTGVLSIKAYYTVKEGGQTNTVSVIFLLTL